jgi:hypothetical protein
MPTSPLTATLVGSSDNNLLGLDSSLLNANQDIQTGEAIQNQALSTRPVAGPVGALAQALMAVPGAYIKAQGTNNLTKTIADGIDAAKDIFDETTPVGKGLRSSSALVRALTFQQIPTVLKINSETNRLSPTETAGQFGSTRATSAGSPALAGNVAGAEAKARAPYEPGGDVTIQTPNGPQVIPATAATRAAIQPFAPQQPPLSPPRLAPPLSSVPKGTSASPSAAIPPPQPKAALSDTTKDQDRVPAQGAIPGSPPVGAVGGKPLPNAAIEPMVKADTEEVAKDREAANKGQQEMATIRAIQDFAPKVKTGWSADTKLEGARILKSMGVSDDQIKGFLNTDVAAGQILQKKFVELSAAAARNMGAREPGSVIQMFAKAYPNLGTDPQAVALQTNALYMDRLRSQHLAEEKTNYLNDSVNGVQSTGQYRGLKGFNEAFNKSHPAESYLHAAEAMSGAPEPWTRVTGTAQRNAIIGLIPAGTKYLAPDGKMHVTPGGAQ